MALIGVARGDDALAAERAAKKLGDLRIFPDTEGRMNLDTLAAGGEFLVVSQFTLAGSLTKGRRPSFGDSAPAAMARPLVGAVADNLRLRGFRVQEGRFGAAMEVELVNDGPVTFVLDV